MRDKYASLCKYMLSKQGLLQNIHKVYQYCDQPIPNKLCSNMDKTNYMKQEAMKYSYNRCSKFSMGEADCIPDINKLGGKWEIWKLVVKVGRVEK